MVVTSSTGIISIDDVRSPFNAAPTAAASGVVSINGTAGAFTFNGDVQCTGTTCDFSPDVTLVPAVCDGVTIDTAVIQAAFDAGYVTVQNSSSPNQTSGPYSCVPSNRKAMRG